MIDLSSITVKEIRIMVDTLPAHKAGTYILTGIPKKPPRPLQNKVNKTTYKTKEKIK